MTTDHGLMISAVINAGQPVLFSRHCHAATGAGWQE